MKVHVERLGASDEEYIVISVNKKSSSKVNKDEVVVIYESSKTTFEALSPIDGYVRVHVALKDTVRAGDLLFEVEEVQQRSQASEPPETQKSSNALISKEALLLADKEGIDWRSLGLDIVTLSDIKNLVINDESNLNKEKARKDVLAPREIVGAKLSHFSERAPGIYFVDGAIDETANIGDGVKIDCNHLYIGKHVSIGKNVILKAKKIYIGDYSRIGSDVIAMHSIYAGNLHVDQKCMIGSKTYLNTESDIHLGANSCVAADCKLITHRQWISPFEGGESFFSAISIEKNCFIGPGTVIMPGVVIQKNSTVMANSTVITDVEEGVMAGGVPAVQIKKNRSYNLYDQTNEKKYVVAKRIIESINRTTFGINYLIEIGEVPFTYVLSETLSGRSFLIKICFSKSDIFKEGLNIMLNDNLPSNYEGVEIVSHKLVIYDDQVRDFIYNLFYGNAVRLSIESLDKT